jgi:hypothetical protein
VRDKKFALDDVANPGCLESCQFALKPVFFDRSAQLAETVGLIAGSDTLVTDATGATGSLRLILKIDKDLDGVLLAFNGGSVPGLPTVTGAAAVVSTNGGLTVTPTAPGTSPTQVVLDLGMSGLVVGRAVSISAIGQKNQKPTTAAVPVLVVPIVAAPQPQTKGATTTP